MTVQIYGSWSIIAQVDDIGNRDVKLTKVKKGEDEHSIYIPESALVTIGKWLDLRKRLKELEG